MTQQILDMTCGGRMMWWDKTDPRILAMDCRDAEYTLCDGRTFAVHPDLLGDFRNLPHPNETFSVVLFDPPHLINAGEKGWQRKKYGKLDRTTYGQDIKAGLQEALRVLKPGGVLVFKWNTEQISLNQIAALFPIKPILRTGERKLRADGKKGNTYIILFVKP